MYARKNYKRLNRQARKVPWYTNVGRFGRKALGGASGAALGFIAGGLPGAVAGGKYGWKAGGKFKRKSHWKNHVFASNPRWRFGSNREPVTGSNPGRKGPGSNPPPTAGGGRGRRPRALARKKMRHYNAHKKYKIRR